MLVYQRVISMCPTFLNHSKHHRMAPPVQRSPARTSPFQLLLSAGKGGVHKWGILMENPIEMDDSEVPPFWETYIYICMYMYMYICMYIYICYAYAFAYAYAYAYAYACMYIYIYVCLCICVSLYMYVCNHMCISLHISVISDLHKPM